MVVLSISEVNPSHTQSCMWESSQSSQQQCWIFFWKFCNFAFKKAENFNFMSIGVKFATFLIFILDFYRRKCHQLFFLHSIFHIVELHLTPMLIKIKFSAFLKGKLQNFQKNFQHCCWLDSHIQLCVWLGFTSAVHLKFYCSCGRELRVEIRGNGECREEGK